MKFFRRIEFSIKEKDNLERKIINKKDEFINYNILL